MDIISCREWMLGSIMHGFPLVIKQIIMLIQWIFLVSNKQTTWKFLHFHSCFEKLTLVFEICLGLWFEYWQCYGCSKRRDRHEDIFFQIWNQLNTMRVEFLVKIFFFCSECTLWIWLLDMLPFHMKVFVDFLSIYMDFFLQLLHVQSWNFQILNQDYEYLWIKRRRKKF